MRFQLNTLLLLLILTLGSTAQSFDQLKSEAEELLLQHSRDKAKGVQTSWSEKDKAYQAGDLLMEAAKLATDEPRKFQAYDKAGEAYGQAQTLGKEALNAYRLARDLPSISDQERARVGWEVARRSHQISDYEFIVQLKGAGPGQKSKAYEEIASIYGVAAKEDPKLEVLAVENYFLASVELAQYDPRRAETVLGMASVSTLDIPDRAQAVSYLDRVNQARLNLPLDDNQSIHKAMVESSWAKYLTKLGALDRAASKWKAIGENKDYKSHFREEAWIALADLYHSQQKLDPALRALESATKQRSDNYVFSEKIALKQVALYDQAKRPDDAAAVLKSLSKHPKISAPKKEQVLLNLVQRLYKLKQDGDADRILSIILEKPAQRSETLLQVTKIRTQHAIDQNDYSQARSLVDAGLKQLSEFGASSQFLQLKLTSGKLYHIQGDYSAAFDEYTASCAVQGVLRHPTDEAVGLAHGALKSAIQEKKLDQAKHIVDTVAQSWSVHPIITAVLRARCQVASNEYGNARHSLNLAKSYLNSLYGTHKENFEAEITEIENILPK